MHNAVREFVIKSNHSEQWNAALCTLTLRNIFFVMEGESCFDAPTSKPWPSGGITLGFYMGGIRFEQRPRYLPQSALVKIVKCKGPQIFRKSRRSHKFLSAQNGNTKQVPYRKRQKLGTTT